MRPHSEKLVSLIQHFYETHLQQCLDITEALAIAFATVADFNFILRSVLPLFLKANKYFAYILLKDFCR